MWDFSTVGSGGGESVKLGNMTWLVLDKAADGSRKLLLAEQDMYVSWLPEDSVEREAQNGDFTWEASFAREYLNGRFVEEHFSQEERALICEVSVENKGNPFGDAFDCPPTVDKVFMLSLEEAVRYFESNPRAEELCILEGQLFYTRTPLNRKWPVSPILFNLEEQWGETAAEYDYDDGYDDRAGEILKTFPDISGLAMNTLNAWVDYTEDTINVRPVMWVSG